MGIDNVTPVIFRLTFTGIPAAVFCDVMASLALLLFFAEAMNSGMEAIIPAPPATIKITSPV